MKIEITKATITIPNKIVVDGIDYPRTQHNVEVVKAYWRTGDETKLNRLSTVVLDLGDS